MKRDWRACCCLLMGVLVLGTGDALAREAGSIVGWGGRVTVEQASLENMVAVAAGWNHSLGLKTDGKIVAWGDNADGQCVVPEPNADFIAAAGGWAHSLGLKCNGTIVAWGNNAGGQCVVPEPNADFIAVAGGHGHSLGLKSDGTIVAWGDNTCGQCEVPSPNADFIAVAAGESHSLGLKSDGTIVAWGRNEDGQCEVPSPNADFIAVTAGESHSLGLRANGTIVAWGDNTCGQCDVPYQNADFIAVAPGESCSLGLKSDGRIVTWGTTWSGREMPYPNADFTAIAAGKGHVLGLRSYGAVAAWGLNDSGQCDVPVPNDDFILTYFHAEREGREAHIVWEVSKPSAFLGFHLWRREPGSERVRITATLLDKWVGYFQDEAPPSGAVEYWLQGITTEGKENWYGPVRLALPVPLRLAQNHPNPFNPRTTIDYDLPQAGFVRLAIYDVRGALVATLVDAYRTAGEHSTQWDGLDRDGTPRPSGVYFARLQTKQGVRTVKLMLAR